MTNSSEKSSRVSDHEHAEIPFEKSAEPGSFSCIRSQAYMDTIRDLVRSGEQVSLIVSGHSMSPFLADRRDSILIESPQRKLRTGDMVFFQRRDGTYIMHRICRQTEAGFMIVGDKQTVIEGPIAREQIFAIVTKVRRKGTWIDSGSAVWWFFARVWIHLIPYRRFLLRTYTRIRHNSH